MKWFWRCLTYFNTLTNECEGGIRHTCSWFWPCCCRHCRYMYIYVCKPERRFFIFGGTYFNATRRDCCSRRVLVSCWKGWSATAPYFPHPRKRKSKSATKTQPQPVSRIDFDFRSPFLWELCYAAQLKTFIRNREISITIKQHLQVYNTMTY